MTDSKSSDPNGCGKLKAEDGFCVDCPSRAQWTKREAIGLAGTVGMAFAILGMLWVRMGNTQELILDNWSQELKRWEAVTEIKEKELVDLRREIMELKQVITRYEN